MRVGAVLQARMSSERLPGKVLRPLAGKPAIEYMLDRLAHANELDATVVATSDEQSDDPVATYCHQHGVAVHRGRLLDVASRLHAAAQAHDLDAVVRLSGDSPFIDQALVDEAVALFRGEQPDLVTNVFPKRTFPHGQSVEVIARKLLAESSDPEHVTPGFYAEAERWHIESLESGEDSADRWLTVDTEDDARRIEAIMQSMDRDHWTYSWREVLELDR